MKKEASRQESSLIFEGMTSFNAVVRSHSRKITKVMVDAARTSTKKKELAFVKKIAAESGFPVEFCDADTIAKIATGTSHGGIIFECEERVLPKISEIDFESDTDGIKGFYVMLEGIEDPYNFGYVLRSLYAAGVSGVILSPRNWMSAAGVVCRSSAGASEMLPIFVGEPEDTVELFRSEGYRIVCAGIRDSVSVYDCDMSLPLLFIVGGEKRGISAKLLSLADDVVRLDYGRNFNGSLSAASAASILAYEVFRQNRNQTDNDRI